MVKLTEKLALVKARASDLENVKKLNCWGSSLTDVSIVRKMPNVQVLSLSVNQIGTLKDFASCSNLEELYIRKNDIADLSEICYLKVLPKLRTLWLADNPCDQEENYRMTILRLLPNLTKLDNVAVTEQEVNDAIDLQSSHQSACGDCEDLNGKTIGEDTLGSTNGIQVTTKSDSPTCSGDTEKLDDDDDDPSALSLEETNSIRKELGLKPLPIEKVPVPSPKVYPSIKNKSENILQAVLCLVKELDHQSLQIVQEAVRNRLENI